MAERYEIVRRLGAGASGSVYEVHDRHTQELRALKLLGRAHGHVAGEFRALARLDHPGCVRVRELGDDPRHGAFLVLDLVTGTSPDEAVPVGDSPALLAFARRITEVLGYLHANDVVHGDLKPDNIRCLGGEPGQPVLLDFGLAAVAGHSTQAGGTPRYMAPELVRGGSPDARSDLYALGVLLYERVAGRPPFPRGEVVEVLRAHLGEAPPPLALHAPRARPELCQLVEGLLAKEPGARPASAWEVLEALAAVDGARLDAQPPAAEPQLVVGIPGLEGRDDVLAAFEARLAAAAGGDGGLLLLGGPAGSGRSRALAELGVRARLAGAIVVPVGEVRGPASGSEVLDALVRCNRDRLHAVGNRQYPSFASAIRCGARGLRGRARALRAAHERARDRQVPEQPRGGPLPSGRLATRDGVLRGVPARGGPHRRAGRAGGAAQQPRRALSGPRRPRAREHAARARAGAGRGAGRGPAPRDGAREPRGDLAARGAPGRGDRGAGGGAVPVGRDRRRGRAARDRSAALVVPRCGRAVERHGAGARGVAGAGQRAARRARGGHACALLGAAERQAGRLQVARAVVERGLRVVSPTGAVLEEARLRLEHAEVLAALGDVALARREGRAAEQAFARLDAGPDRVAARRLLSRLGEATSAHLATRLARFLELAREAATVESDEAFLARLLDAALHVVRLHSGALVVGAPGDGGELMRVERAPWAGPGAGATADAAVRRELLSAVTAAADDGLSCETGEWAQLAARLGEPSPARAAHALRFRLQGGGSGGLVLEAPAGVTAVDPEVAMIGPVIAEAMATAIERRIAEARLREALGSAPGLSR